MFHDAIRLEAVAISNSKQDCFPLHSLLPDAAILTTGSLSATVSLEGCCM